jgi:hypothetical protein
MCMWSLDRCQRLIGERMMGLLAWRTPNANKDVFFDGLGLGLLTRWLGMTPEAVREAYCAVRAVYCSAGESHICELAHVHR